MAKWSAANGKIELGNFHLLTWAFCLDPARDLVYMRIFLYDDTCVKRRYYYLNKNIVWKEFEEREPLDDKDFPYILGKYIFGEGEAQVKNSMWEWILAGIRKLGFALM